MTGELLSTVAGAVVAALLLLSAVLSLVAAFGLLRMPDAFQRMHSTALVSTLGILAVGLAYSIDFLWVDPSPGGAWEGVLVVALVTLGTPITTVVLARAILYRVRATERTR